MNALADQIRSYFQLPFNYILKGVGRRVDPVYVVNCGGSLKSEISSVTAVQDQWYDVLDGGAAIAAPANAKKLKNIVPIHLCGEMQTANEDLDFHVISGDFDDDVQMSPAVALNCDMSDIYIDIRWIVTGKQMNRNNIL